jgi:multidrug resistance efflux pump
MAKTYENAKESEKDEIVHDGVRTRMKKNKLLIGGVILFFVIGIIVGLVYYNLVSSRISVENSQITAPIISIAPQASGVLDRLLVKEGDLVSEREAVAEVSGTKLRTKSAGIIIFVQDTPGQIVSSQLPVVKMINPEELRVVGKVEEDKGLKDIKVGQRVVFTVDAFGSKKYEGVVDSISPTSSESDIVFSISSQRQAQNFEVKVRFDFEEYPELKNGMSAKMYIYK